MNNPLKNITRNKAKQMANENSDVFFIVHYHINKYHDMYRHFDTFDKALNYLKNTKGVTIKDSDITLAIYTDNGNDWEEIALVK